MHKKYRDVLWAVFSVLLIGLAVFITSRKPFIQTFYPAILLGGLGVYGLIRLSRILNSSKTILILLVIGFVLRLGLGLLTTYFLPVIGYQEDPQQAGYLFRDSFNRDSQAWNLAQSDQPIFAAFGSEFISDQYGGLLAISAMIYRTFSPQYHLQELIILVAVLISAMGIIFVGDIFLGSKRASFMAVLLYTFYPDAIIFSASQMREPFLMGLSAVLFWLGFTNRVKGIKKWLIFGLTSLFILLISAKAGVFLILFAFVISFWKSQKDKFSKIKEYYLVIILILFTGALAIISGRWILEASKWDAIVAVQNSGWVELIFKRLPESLHLPFLTLYGLLQPILPAAMVEPSIPFWKVVNIFRAVGWAVLIPFIAYSLFFLIKKSIINRKLWVFLTIFVLFWLTLSALRAGGDMWDNPRYRLTMMVPIALLFGVSADSILISRDHWFVRIILAEVVFNLFFLQWYLSRYTSLFGRLEFPVMIALISVSILAIFLQGIFFHKFKRRNILK